MKIIRIKKLKEQRFLVKVLIRYIMANRTFLFKFNDKTYVYKKGEDNLKVLLRKIKAKDDIIMPRSIKGVTYQSMIDGAKNNSDNVIWVWSTYIDMLRNECN